MGVVLALALTLGPACSDSGGVSEPDGSGEADAIVDGVPGDTPIPDAAGELPSVDHDAAEPDSSDPVPGPDVDTGGTDDDGELPAGGSGAVWANAPVCTPPAPPTRSYEAVVRWTSYGVPHISGATFPDVAFGQGYAFARDHACVMLDQAVMVRSERARWFGAGDDDVHVDSDFAYRAVGLYETAACGLGELPQEARDALFAYAAGFNQHLDEVGSSGLPARCAGEPWVGPISAVDLLAHELRLSIVSSAGPFLEAIARAEPPGPQTGGLTPTSTPAEVPVSSGRSGLASNGWALGNDKTASGAGMLLANPHLPYEGELRFHEAHLTVPGELDVYGAALLGTVGVTIGFNRDLAWTHTVASSVHFTLYKLALDPSDPESYIYGGESVALTKRSHEIDLLTPAGTVQTVSRVLYQSHFGPVVTLAPLFWTPSLALAMRDANADNLETLPQRLAAMKADSVEALEAIHGQRGVAWSATVAVDRTGTAIFMDSSRVPNLTAEAIAGWQAQLASGDGFTNSAAAKGVFVLPAEPLYEWAEAGDDGLPLVPWDDVPVLVREDYAFHANDSHWLPHLYARLEGYPKAYGSEVTPRTFRTRVNLMMLTEQGAGAAAGEDGLFDLQELEAAMFGGRTAISELLHEQIAARCEGANLVEYEGATVDVTALCAAIVDWDGRATVDSVGAVAWRQTLGTYVAAAGSTLPFTIPFDYFDPIYTPGGIAPAPPFDADPLLLAAAAAVIQLDEAGVDPAAPLGEVQRLERGGESWPIGGGGDPEGAFDVNGWSDEATLNSTLYPQVTLDGELDAATGLADGGYPVNVGASFIFAVELPTGDGSPTARALLTYGQSDDPGSAHHTDQTALIGQRTLRAVRFAEADIASDPSLIEVTVMGSTP